MDDGQTIDEAIAADQGDAVDEIEIDAPVSEMDEVRGELGIGEGVDPVAALLEAPMEAPTQHVYLRRLSTYFDVEAILDDRAYDKIVERCTRYVRNRRGGGRTREVDGRRLSRLTVAEYTVAPAFSAKRAADTSSESKFEAMAEKFGTREPEDLVDRALLMGEIDLLADAILTLSGFEDELETAGN